MRIVPIVALFTMLLVGACARMPAEEARGTPGETVATLGFARLSSGGLPLGSAVAVAPDRLLTNAHVIPAGAETLRFTRGDGATAGVARVLARSDRMDLAVLAVPPLFVPVSAAPVRPDPDQPVWALGAPAAGPAVVAGRVMQAAVTLPGHGPGFTARIGALLGYSGGPALDGQGRLVGLVTALPQPGAAPLLAALSGFDLDGIVRGQAGREVFFLSIAAVLDEAARIAPR